MVNNNIMAYKSKANKSGCNNKANKKGGNGTNSSIFIFILKNKDNTEKYIYINIYTNNANKYNIKR